MINLLPPVEKEKLSKEYRYRKIVVYAILFSVIFVIGIILMLPSYFLADARERVAEEERAILINSDENTERAEAQAKLLEVKEQLIALNREKVRTPLSTIISEIALYSESVSLHSFSYVRGNEDADSSLRVEGNAQTREGLLLFQKRLEEDDRIDKAVLPVSSLAKDEDIDFTIQINGQF